MAKKVKTEKVKRGYILWAFLALVVLAGGVGQALASPDSPAREYVAKSLADYAAANKDSAVAARLVEWLIVGEEDAEGDAFGQTTVRDFGQQSAIGEDCLIDFETLDTGPVDGVWCEGVLVEAIGGDGTTPTSTFFSIRNRFTEPIYVTDVVMKFDTSPSTTIVWSMGTSSVSAVAYDSLTPPGSILYNLLVATSTLAANVPIQMAYGPSGNQVPNQSGSTTGTNKWTLVAEGDYIVGLMRALNPTVSVTSTAWRGFSTSSLAWVKYARLSTSTPKF